MKEQTAINKLVRAFRSLTDEQKDNLRWHVGNGTGILCGKDFNVFARDGFA